MLTTSGKNQLLTATDVTYLALCSAFPGQTIANEITGGSPAYARKAVAWGTASAGVIASSSAQTFDLPAAANVLWIVGCTAATSGSGRFVAPNGAAPHKFVVDISGDFLLLDAQPYSNTNTVVFYGGTPPAGLTEGTVYFVVGAATDKFQVSATSGGSAINLTGEAADGCRVSIIVAESFGAQGTMSLAIGATTQSLNS